MTTKRFGATWGRLCCAVIQRALDDLTITDKPVMSGFSGCSLAERKKWKKDAEMFFKSRLHTGWVEMGGLDVEAFDETRLAKKGGVRC